MFSGIHSLIFGKKHHKHKQGESLDDSAQPAIDNEFVVLERRHSDEYDRNSGLYPNLDPSQPVSTNLPYVISPSLPNLKEATSGPESPKEETKNMLQGVPFVLSSQILLLDDDANKNFSRLTRNLNDIKESGEESLLEDFNYDFELEHTVSSEFASYDS